MFENIGIGFQIMGKSVRFFFKHPKSIFPIFVTWVIYTGSVIYVTYTYDFSEYTTPQLLLVFYGFTFLFTFLVSISSLVLLELIEQNEIKGKMSLFIAMKDALIKDLIRTLPIIIGWSIIKFLLLLLEIAVKTIEAKSRRSRRVRGAANSAIETLKTGVRMGVMLMLSAIAWEELRTKDAMDKGTYVYKRYFASMATGVALSRVLKFVTFVPIIVLFIFVYSGAQPHLYVWYGAIIYTGLAWSYGIMVEQLFAAELYLWYKLFRDQVKLAKRNGTEEPTKITDVKRPSFIDDIPDMIVKENREFSEWDY